MNVFENALSNTLNPVNPVNPVKTKKKDDEADAQIDDRRLCG